MLLLDGCFRVDSLRAAVSESAVSSPPDESAVQSKFTVVGLFLKSVNRTAGIFLVVAAYVVVVLADGAFSVLFVSALGDALCDRALSPRFVAAL